MQSAAPDLKAADARVQMHCSVTMASAPPPLVMYSNGKHLMYELAPSLQVTW